MNIVCTFCGDQYRSDDEDDARGLRQLTCPRCGNTTVVVRWGSGAPSEARRYAEREGTGQDLTVKYYADTYWHLIVDGAVKQFTLVELCARYKRGAISLSSPVWTKGMPEWAPISSIKALRTALLSNESPLGVDAELANSQPLAREAALLDETLWLDEPNAASGVHKRAVLVPTWLLRVGSVAMLALSAFVLVPDPEPPAQARPKLVLSRDEVSELWVAQSESRIEPTHVAAVRSLSTYDSAPAFDQYRRYANELSRLEGLASCTGPNDIVPADCEGYLIRYQEQPSDESVLERFLVRRATPAELEKLVAMGHVTSQVDGRKR